MESIGRAQSTRRQLCIAAEAMFAEAAPGGVTLRTVAAAAGQKNTGAVAYHFKSRQGLIKAIVDMRIADLDPERRRLIALAEAAGRLDDPLTIWRCITLPMLALRDEAAPHAHVRFTAQMVVTGELNDPFDDSIERPGGEAMAFLLARLHALLGHLPYGIARARIALCGLMFSNAVMLHDEHALGERSQDLDLFVLLDDIYLHAGHMLQASVPTEALPSAKQGYAGYIETLFG